MSKFQDFKDLYDFNREVMEDDFNDGQKYVVKWKKKLDQGTEFATTVKVGEAKEGAHKVAVEEKIKTKMSEMGGLQAECKFKNSGEVSYEVESDCLKVSNTNSDLIVFRVSKVSREPNFCGKVLSAKRTSHSNLDSNSITSLSNPRPI